MEAVTGEMACFFRVLGHTSLQVSLLIGLILFVRLLFGQYLSARWRYALWLLVCIRILIPWGPYSPLSLEHWDSAAVSRVGFKTDFIATRPKPEAANKTNLRQANLSNPMTTIAVESPLPLSTAEDVTALSESENHEVYTPNIRREVLYSDLFIWGIGLIWLMGMGVLAGHILYHRTSLLNGIRDARPLRAQVITDLLDDCRTRLGVTTSIHCIATDAVAGPALLGWIRPRLLLPRHLLRSINRRQLRHIFLHELTHLRRQDIIMGWIVAICQIIHWFNPLVWLAFYLMRADREIACDHEALSVLAPTQIRQYGLTLLRLLEQCNAERSFVLAGIFPERLQLKQRVRSITRFEPGQPLEWASALIFALLAIVGLTRAQPMVQRSSRSQVVPMSAAIVTPIHEAPAVRNPTVVAEPDASLAMMEPAIEPLPATDPIDPDNATYLKPEDRIPSHSDRQLYLENSLKAQERAVWHFASTAKQAILNGLALPPDTDQKKLCPNSNKTAKENKPFEAQTNLQSESNANNEKWDFHICQSVKRNSNGQKFYSAEFEWTWKKSGWTESYSFQNDPNPLPGKTLFLYLTSPRLWSLGHQLKSISKVSVESLERDLSQLHQILLMFNAAILTQSQPMPNKMMCRKGGFVVHEATEQQMVEALAQLTGESIRTAVVKTQLSRMIQINQQAYDAVKTGQWDDAQTQIHQMIEQWQLLIEQIDNDHFFPSFYHNFFQLVL